MDVGPAVHGEGRLLLRRFHDIRKQQSLQFSPLCQFIKILLHFGDAGGHFVPQSFHLYSLLCVVLEGLVLDELEQSFAGELVVPSLADQPGDFSDVDIIENVLGFCDCLIHQEHQFLLYLDEVADGLAGEQQHRRAVVPHEFVEGLQLYELGIRMGVQVFAVRMGTEGKGATWA